MRDPSGQREYIGELRESPATNTDYMGTPMDYEDSFSFFSSFFYNVLPTTTSSCTNYDTISDVDTNVRSEIDNINISSSSFNSDKKSKNNINEPFVKLPVAQVASSSTTPLPTHIPPSRADSSRSEDFGSSNSHRPTIPRLSGIADNSTSFAPLRHTGPAPVTELTCTTDAADDPLVDRTPKAKATSLENIEIPLQTASAKTFSFASRPDEYAKPNPAEWVLARLRDSPD